MRCILGTTRDPSHDVVHCGNVDCDGRILSQTFVITGLLLGPPRMLPAIFTYKSRRQLDCSGL